MDKPIPHPNFWRNFLAATDISDATSRLYGTTTADDSMAAADEAVQQILSGDKTASSALLAEYQATNRPAPQVGSLSILVGEDGSPVAVVETTAVSIERFCDVDDQFARAHGPGQSLKSWRRQCRSAFAARARSMGTPFGEESELICHRFRVVYAAPGAAMLVNGSREPSSGEDGDSGD
jgi:uncharacterized protein YhfF